MHKSRSEYRDGYKGHTAVEPGTGIITATRLTHLTRAIGRFHACRSCRSRDRLVGGAGRGFAYVAGAGPGGMV